MYQMKEVIQMKLFKILKHKEKQMFHPSRKEIELTKFGYEVSQSAHQLYVGF